MSMVTIKIKGKEYTLDEAQELYEELDKIFGRDRNEYWPTLPQLPQQPEYPPYTPTPIWYYTTPTMDTLPNGRISDISIVGKVTDN